MKCLIEKMGNPSRTSEDIKEGCTLFFNSEDFSDNDYLIIRDNNINVTATTKIFLAEMSSEKDHYGFFILNKNDGAYVVYDFLVSVIDNRIADEGYIAQRVCLVLFSRLIDANPNKDVYIRISGNVHPEYLLRLSNHNLQTISAEVARFICMNK